MCRARQDRAAAEWLAEVVFTNCRRIEPGPLFGAAAALHISNAALRFFLRGNPVVD